MCMNEIYPENKLKDFIRRRVDDKGYVTLYKILRIGRDGYTGLSVAYTYKTGLNTAFQSDCFYWPRNGGDKNRHDTYKSGYHCFCNLQDAKRCIKRLSMYNNTVVVKIRVHKKWMRIMGSDGIGGPIHNCIVVDKGYFPSPKNKKAVLAEKEGISGGI